MTLDELIDQAIALRNDYPGDTPVVVFIDETQGGPSGCTRVMLPMQRATTEGGPSTVVGFVSDCQSEWPVGEHPDAGKG